MLCNSMAIAVMLLPLGRSFVAERDRSCGKASGQPQRLMLASDDEVSLLQTSLWDAGPDDSSKKEKAAKHKALTADDPGAKAVKHDKASSHKPSAEEAVKHDKASSHKPSAEEAAKHNIAVSDETVAENITWDDLTLENFTNFSGDSLLDTSMSVAGPNEPSEPSDAEKAAKPNAVPSEEDVERDIEKDVAIYIPGRVDNNTNSSQEIKLIGAGMGRSGTSSYMCALKRLGYNPAPGTLLMEQEIDLTLTPGVPHWVVSDMESKPLYQEVWMDWAHGGAFEPCYEQLTSIGYNATIGEIPAGYAYGEILDRNPSSKVVLLVHPGGAEAWAGQLFDREGDLDPTGEGQYWGGCFPDERSEYMSQFIKCCDFSLNLTDIDRLDTCILEYKEEVRKVEEAVPPEQLLKYSVDMGWEPLCEFLGLEVPPEPFPYDAPDPEGCSSSGFDHVYWEWQEQQVS